MPNPRKIKYRPYRRIPRPKKEMQKRLKTVQRRERFFKALVMFLRKSKKTALKRYLRKKVLANLRKKRS